MWTVRRSEPNSVFLPKSRSSSSWGESCPTKASSILSKPRGTSRMHGSWSPEEDRDGLLADPVNPRDLAEKIRRLLSDPKARRTMGARGREKVLESFSIERVTDRIEAVYRAILDGSEATTARP